MEHPIHKTASRHNGLDLLRLLSLLGVIVIHLCSSAWNDLPVSSLDWQALNLYDGLFRFSVPCFVMISGALMLSPERSLPLAELWKRRIPRLGVAWLFWTLVYAGRFLLQYILNGDPAELSAFWNAMGGRQYHLWFMGMILGLYILLPILRPLAEDRKLLKYFLLLSFLVSILIPTLAMIDPIAVPLTGFIDRFMLHLPLGFSFYFLLGYYLSTESLEKKQQRWILVLGLVGTILIILGTGLGNLIYPALRDRLYTYLSLFPAMSAAGIFLFFAKSKQKEPGKTARSFLALNSRLAFGIYLVHECFNIVFPHLGIFVTSLPTLLSVPLLAVVTYGGSFMICWVISKIPLLKNWII